MTIKTIQILENFGKAKADAEVALDCLRMQDGFIAGRILADSPAKPGWKVQAFITDEDTEWLPDGMRHVVILDGLATELGI